MSQFSKILFLYTVVFIILLCYPGCYYEDLSDVNFMILSEGYLTSEPVALFNNYGAHFLLSHVYVLLNSIFHFNWYAILNTCFMYFAGANLLYCADLSTGSSGRIFRFLFISMIGLFLLNDVVFLQYTKTSIYFLFSSIWILTYHWRHSDTLPQRTRMIVFQSAILLAGLLLRQFSVFLIGLLYFPVLAFGIYKSSQKKWKQILFPGLIFLITSVAVIVLALQAYNPVDRVYGRFAEFKNSVWDNGQSQNTLNLITKNDSIAYECLSNFFIPEQKVINPELLKKIGIQETHSPVSQFKASLAAIPNKLQLAQDRWIELASEPSRLLVIFIALAFLLAFSWHNKNIFLRQIACIAWFSACLFIISVIAKMEERVLYPSLVILLVVLSEMRRGGKDEKISFGQKLLIAFLCLSSLYCLRIRHYEAWLRRVGQQEIRALISDIRTEHPGQIIMLDWLTVSILGNRVCWTDPDVQTVKWFTMDPGYLIFYPPYYEKEKELTGCPDYGSLIRYIQNHKGNFVFLYSINRIELLQKYCQRSYGVQLNFVRGEELFPKGSIINGRYLYHKYTVE